MCTTKALVTGLAMAMSLPYITGFMYFASLSCEQNICLAGNIVKEFEGFSENRCALECFQVEECLSYNYMRQENSDKTICQMVTLKPGTQGRYVFGCLNRIRIGFKATLDGITKEFCSKQSYSPYWTKALHHDENGVVLYGDKSLLLDAVKNGASLRLQSEKTQVIESHDIKNIYWDPSDRSIICGQTFATYTKFSFKDVNQVDNKWQYHVICTNGTNFTVTVTVGNENDTVTSSTKQGFSWFFKRSTHEVTTDSPQEYLKNLRDAFENGNSFLSLDDMSSMYLSTTYLNSSDDNITFYGQTVDNVRFHVTDVNDIESIFHIKAISHDGHDVLAPWPVEGRQKASPYQEDLRDVHWYTDDKWEKVYVNDAAGQTLFGSLGYLIDVALSGRAIRFICSFSEGQISQTASYIKTANGKLFVVSVGDLVETNGTDFTEHMFPDEMKEVWLVVSTDGIVREYYMSLVKRDIIEDTEINSQISWFAAKRHPIMALDVDQSGHHIGGSYSDLYIAVINGASVTIQQSGNVFRPTTFAYTDTILVANIWMVSILESNNSWRVNLYTHLMFELFSTDGTFSYCKWLYGSGSQMGCGAGSTSVTFYVTQ